MEDEWWNSAGRRFTYRGSRESGPAVRFDLVPINRAWFLFEGDRGQRYKAPLGNRADSFTGGFGHFSIQVRLVHSAPFREQRANRGKKRDEEERGGLSQRAESSAKQRGFRKTASKWLAGIKQVPGQGASIVGANRLPLPTPDSVEETAPVRGRLLATSRHASIRCHPVRHGMLG